MRRLDDTRHLRHHAFVIEAEAEAGIQAAGAWIEETLGMKAAANPDVIVLRYGLLSVEDARGIIETAMSTPFIGAHKALIISASRAYHEAQNALLKLFEEPPPNAYLFLIIPALGALLPTLRSRVHVLEETVRRRVPDASLIGEAFLNGGREKRTAIIKRLTSGRDEEERRELRDEAIALVDGVEKALVQGGVERHAAALSDIARLRGYLHERGAPVKMILEHLSIVTPKRLI